MNATAPAVRPDPPAPARRRRFFRGVAAAGALSLAVHAAVLLVRPTTGSGSAPETRPGSVLVTRLVEAPATASASLPPEAQPAAEPVPEPQPAVSEAPGAEAPQPRVAEPEVPVPPAAPPAPPQAPAPQPPAVAAARAEDAASTPGVTAASTYRGAAGLDPPPRLLGDVDPAMPSVAGPRGGVVVLRLFINEQGAVDRAEVLSSTPPGLFDASALEAFGNARFAPGYLAGVPVRSQVTFEVKYRGLGGNQNASKTY